jgi:polyhydroxyalkanoate synthesis regulator phasin
MATGSSGSRSKSGSRSSSGSGSSKKRTTSKSTASKSTASKSTASKRTASKRTASKRTGTSSASASQAGRADKSVEAFRDALERSVTLSRDRLQDAVDDAVKRGRMTREDANELVSSLLTRSRRYSDDLVKQLERLLDQAQREIESRTGSARRRATTEARRAARAARDAADAPLAQADRLRRRSGVTAGGPITAYDQLTANQIKTRLSDLSPAELRRVRTREQRGKARKGVLSDIDRRLERTKS